MASTLGSDDDDWLTALDRSIEVDFGRPPDGDDGSNGSASLSLLQHHHPHHQQDPVAAAEALRLVEARLLTDPDDVDKRVLRASLLLRQRDCAAALADLDHAVALAPQHVVALYTCGVCLSALGRFAEAVTSFSAVLQLCPDHFHAAFGRAASYNSLGYLDLAIDDYQFALSREEELFQYDGNGDDGRRRRRLGGVRDADVDDVEGDVQRALDAASRSLGLPTAAATAAACPTTQPPPPPSSPPPPPPRPDKRPPTTKYLPPTPHPPSLENLHVHANRNSTGDDSSSGAGAYSISGHYATGAQDLSAVTLADELHRRGFLLRLQGKYQEALALYDRALSIYPPPSSSSSSSPSSAHRRTLFKVRFNRAFALDKLDRIDEAIGDYSLALSLLPGDEDDGPGDDGGAGTTQRLLHRAYAHYNRGICHDRAGRLRRAVDDFAAAIHAAAAHAHAHAPLSPSSRADFHFNKGYAHMRLHEYAAAAADLHMALTLRPDHAKTASHLQTCQELMNR